MFSIIGIAKHKERSRLLRTLQHHLREVPVLNADSSLAQKNVRAGAPGNAAAVAATVFARVEPLVRRKDAVRAIELNLAASPEFFQRHGGSGTSQQLWDAAKKFLRDTFGRENVIAWGMHRDETSPHVWAIVTPIHELKLRASNWLDGPKKLAALHDKWASATAHLGLQRGAEKSGAKHIDIGTYYAAVNGLKSGREVVSREMSRRAARAREKVAEIEQRERQVEATFKALDRTGKERVLALMAASRTQAPTESKQAAPAPVSVVRGPAPGR